MPRHFRSLDDVTRDELVAILDRADALKATRGSHDKPLMGKSVAVILEKASTRTRLSFEVGIHELGAQPITVIAKDTQMARGEPIEDTAHMLSGYVHGVVFRTFAQERLEAMCTASTVPVINGLTDRYHPCQLLADLQTVRECHGALEGVTVAWVGDGNNMAHSWILAAGKLGMRLRLACPEGYLPSEDMVAGARVITTDVWASMGQEAEAAARERAFVKYEVDDALMAGASDDAIFLHCLPAHRGEEVAASVIDGPASRVWQEAENRLHAQKALLLHVLA